jgi:hypothetical protein
MLASVSQNYLDLILKTFSDPRPVNKGNRRNKHYGDFFILLNTEEYGEAFRHCGAVKGGPWINKRECILLSNFDLAR